MNVTGIIAEYNPFHNGHAYHIKQARKLTNADYVIVIMSGNYVQRGAPAIIDKFARAKMALNNGADLVFELPSLWSSSAAPDFAAAGIAFLDKLGCVTHVSYGCETNQPEMLFALADILIREPKDFALPLIKHQKEGMNFPLAMECAFLDYLKGKNLPISGITSETVHNIFSSPNNILALEYQKAILERQSGLKACPVPRQGSGYHVSDLETEFPSATGIRHALLKGEKVFLEEYMPKSAAILLPAKPSLLLQENDFSQMLYYKLLSEKSQGYERYMGSSPFLSNRIQKQLESFLDYTSFCELIKTKDVTYTKISRLLLHILLGLTIKDEMLGKALDHIPYFRLLGFRKKAESLLKIIWSKGDTPILTKPSEAEKLLSEKAFTLYEKDLFSSNLYYGVQGQKGKCGVKNEYRKSLVIL